MPPIVLVALVVFLQLLCVGANFSTLDGFGRELGGGDIAVGLLWLALSGPRAIFSPFWGGLSDRFGRKALLIAGTLGTIAGSLVWAWSGAAYGLLLLSRIVDSSLSAQATIAQSVVADVAPPEKRAASLGLLGAAASMAFVLGPLLGAAVSSAAGFHAVGWMMAGLQAIALVLIVVFFRETRPAHADGATRGAGVLSTVVWRRVLSFPALLGLLIVALVMTAGYTHFNTAYPAAVGLWFDGDQWDVAKAFGVLGLVSALVQGGLLRVLLKRFAQTQLLSAGVVLMGASFIGFALAPPEGALLWLVALLATGASIAIPCLTSMTSEACRPQDVGMVMGLHQSMQTLGRGVGPFAASALFVLAPAISFGSAVVLLVIAWVLAVRLARRARTQTPSPA